MFLLIIFIGFQPQGAHLPVPVAPVAPVAAAASLAARPLASRGQSSPRRFG